LKLSHHLKVATLAKMVLNSIHPTPIEDDDSTIFTSQNTPPETVVAGEDDFFESQDPLGDSKMSSSVPWPGMTFIIRETTSGQVLTLLDGKITLASPGGPGNIHWECVETKGWLGFRNRVSGRYLGHDKDGKLHCSAGRQQMWENFCVRLRPDGGYVLLMTHFERLWHVGFKMERGMEILAKIGDGGSDGMVWEFVKI
jgi:hypothetical protein